MVSVLLVGGASGFGLVLAKKLRAVGAKVFIFDTHQADLDDVEFVLGSMDNSFLLRRVVNEMQVCLRDYNSFHLLGIVLKSDLDNASVFAAQND